MNKKQFRRYMSSNPALGKWMKENETWLRSKPEVMMYIFRNPNGMQQFRSGEPIDNEKLAKNAQQFANQMMEERRNMRAARMKENRPARPEGNVEGVRQRRSGGLFGNLKNMFPFMAVNPFMAGNQQSMPAANMKLPALKPPVMMPSFARAFNPGKQQNNQIPQKRSLFQLPKINIDREKLLRTMSQTTEMLDVVSALMGKLGSLK